MCNSTSFWTLIPRDTDYSSILESSLSIVVQHICLDSRRSDLALLNTLLLGSTESAGS
ncbi:MAG: sensory rhodopsin transducer [Leptospirales bacterium]